MVVLYCRPGTFFSPGNVSKKIPGTQGDTLRTLLDAIRVISNSAGNADG